MLGNCPRRCCSRIQAVTLITPRPYQQDCHDKTLDSLRTSSGFPVVVLPTGSGKSVNIAMMAEECVNGGGRVLILSHVKEILQQNHDKIKSLIPSADIGIYSAGLGGREKSNQITVASIQSVYNKAGALGRYDLILLDEAHMVSNDQQSDTMYHAYINKQKIINPNVAVIGYTATPYRLSGGPIYGTGRLFSHVCYSVDVGDLIEQGYLSQLISKEGGKFDTTGAKIVAGDFNQKWLSTVMDDEDKIEMTVSTILEMTKNRNSVLIFCVDVKHCDSIRHEITRQQGGVNLLELVEGGPQKTLEGVGQITGSTPSAIRDLTLQNFKEGKTKFLVNCQVLTTGMDAPNVDCVVMLRPTMSVSLYVQMVGRGLRLHPNKADTLVLDFAGNVARHGAIDTIEICGRTVSKKTGVAPTKTCQACKAIVPIQCIECPNCSNQFEMSDNGLKHDHVPDTKTSILSTGQPVDETHEVRDVMFRVHTKKGDPNAPKTMRVDYICGVTTVFSEWICVEHTGFAKTKAAGWWYRHSMIPMPATAAEAVRIANGGGVALPDEIVVRTKPGVKYTEIIRQVISQEKPSTFNKTLASEDHPFASTPKPSKVVKPAVANPTKQFDFGDAYEGAEQDQKETSQNTSAPEDDVPF